MLSKIIDSALAAKAEPTYSGDIMGYDWGKQGKKRKIRGSLEYDGKTWVCYGASYGFEDHKENDPPNSFRETVVTYCVRIIPREEYTGEIRNDIASHIFAVLTDPDGREWVAVDEKLEIYSAEARLVMYTPMPKPKKKKNPAVTVIGQRQDQLMFGGLDYESEANG